MTMKSQIEERLNAAFQPTQLDVIDESHLHAGHAGSRESGETHFRVRIVADRFAGATRLQRHRLVNEALVEELAASIHALAIDAKAPE